MKKKEQLKSQPTDSKDEISNTTTMRVTVQTAGMANKVQQIVAVESGGKILNKPMAVQVALEEFLDKRQDG